MRNLDLVTVPLPQKSETKISCEGRTNYLLLVLSLNAEFRVCTQKYTFH